MFIEAPRMSSSTLKLQREVASTDFNFRDHHCCDDTSYGVKSVAPESHPAMFNTSTARQIQSTSVARQEVKYHHCLQVQTFMQQQPRI